MSEIELRINKKYTNIIDEKGNKYGTYTENVLKAFASAQKGSEIVVKLKKLGSTEKKDEDDEGFNLFNSDWFKE